MQPITFEQMDEFLGGELHRISSDVLCLRELLSFTDEKTLSKFPNLINYGIRVLFDRIFLAICRLLDKTKGSVGLPRYLRFIGREDLWKGIEKEEFFEKIKEWRDETIAHSNENCAKDPDYLQQLHEKDKVHLSEIESFLKLVQKTLEEAYNTHSPSTVLSFYGLGACDELRELQELKRMSEEPITHSTTP